MRTLSPPDFDVIFSAKKPERRPAHEEWFRMLEAILDSGDEDVITALQSNLIVFHRHITNQPQTIAGITVRKPKTFAQAAEAAAHARKRTKTS